jgi:hypothetical protein
MTQEQEQSTLIFIIGKSGRGKSTAIRNLPPEDTYLINVVGKPLPFQSGRLYTKEKNLCVLTDANMIIQAMHKISKAGFTHLIIDDMQYIMASEFMLKALERGYDKFSIMARNMWNIFTTAITLESKMKVYILAHEDDTGKERKIKTLGKMLDEKVTPEGLSSIVLFADTEVTDKNKRTYYFSTQTDGDTNAKSPMNMFPQRIPNDLKLVSDRIDEYYQGVALKDSKIDFNLM